MFSNVKFFVVGLYIKVETVVVYQAMLVLIFLPFIICISLLFHFMKLVILLLGVV